MKRIILLLQLIMFVSVSNCFGQYTTLFEFNGDNGRNPSGLILSDSAYLYGTTFIGGATSNGVIYKMKTDGTDFTKLYDFNNVSWFIDGKYPFGPMILDNSFYLYGLTRDREGMNAGTIFKIKTDGTGYERIYEFEPTPNPPTGTEPASLVSDGTYLYGTTVLGGTNNLGVFFRVNKDGHNYTVLYNFDNNSGGMPESGLFFDGTFFYGLTATGGAANLGTLFKIKYDGSEFVKLLDFLGDSNGANPYFGTSLIFDGTFLYGMTSMGGVNNLGTIFKIHTDGTNYSKLFDFSRIDGQIPEASLLLINNHLYGTCYGGKDSIGLGSGLLFTISTDGTGYTILKYGDSLNILGSTPISDNKFLYSTVWQPEKYGSIFKYKLPVYFEQSLTVCANDSVIVGNHSYHISGIFTDKLKSKKEDCDSIVTTKIIVLPENYRTETITICSGESYKIGNDTYTKTGNYKTIFKSLINGCDSIVNTHLTVLYSSGDTTIQDITICDGHSLTVGADSYFKTGTYTYKFAATNCDSTVITKLNVLPNASFIQSPCLALGQTIKVGIHTYYNTGNYIDTLVAFNSCDSIVTTKLTVIDTSLTIHDYPNNTHFMMINYVSKTATYQWIECDSGIIAGATDRYYFVKKDGKYAVQISEDSCTVSSSCYEYTHVGIKENNLSNQLSVYPNPANGLFTIDFHDLIISTAKLVIYNSYGENIFSCLISNTSSKIDIGNQAAGIYFLVIETNIGVLSKKIIIDKN